MVGGSGSFNEDKRSIDLDKLESYLSFKAGFVLLRKTRRVEKNLLHRVDRIAPAQTFLGRPLFVSCLMLWSLLIHPLLTLPLRWESQHCCYCRFAQIGGGAKEARVRLGILVALYSGKRSLTNGKRHLNLFVRQLPE